METAPLSGVWVPDTFYAEEYAGDDFVAADFITDLNGNLTGAVFTDDETLLGDDSDDTETDGLYNVTLASMNYFDAESCSYNYL